VYQVGINKGITVEPCCKNFGSPSSCNWKIVSFTGYLSPFNHLYSVPQGDSRNLTVVESKRVCKPFHFWLIDNLLVSVFMSQHQELCTQGERSWSMKRQHQSNQSIFWIMTFVIFRKWCKIMSQFQKWVNTKFCLYDWASQAHRCTTNPLIHLQMQNFFCLLFLLVMVPPPHKKKTKQTNTNNINKFRSPTKTDYMPSYITGRLGLYFAIIMPFKIPFQHSNYVITPTLCTAWLAKKCL